MKKPMIFTVVAVLPESDIEVQVSDTAWLHWVEACEWMANHPSYKQQEQRCCPSLRLKVEGFMEYTL